MATIKEKKVLMIGPSLESRGGITEVVRGYIEEGITKKVGLRYLATTDDGSKVYKVAKATIAFLHFSFLLPRYDVIHVNMASNTSFSRKSFFINLADLFNKKIIIHLHGGGFKEFYEAGSVIKKNRIKKVLARSERLIALSEEWKAFLSTLVDENKIVVINNGVLIGDCDSRGYQDLNVLFLGKMCKEKGIYDLIDAVPSIIQKHKRAHFYLCGNGEIENVKKYCAKRGINNNVSILGWIEKTKKEELFYACSTLVLPSYKEGLPMSVLEAMAHGLAVVACRVGGIPSLIKDGVNGILVNPGRIEELQMALEYVLGDNLTRKNLGTNAFKTAKDNYSVSNVVNELVDLYYKI